MKTNFCESGISHEKNFILLSILFYFLFYFRLIFARMIILFAIVCTMISDAFYICMIQNLPKLEYFIWIIIQEKQWILHERSATLWRWSNSSAWFTNGDILSMLHLMRGPQCRRIKYVISVRVCARLKNARPEYQNFAGSLRKKNAWYRHARAWLFYTTVFQAPGEDTVNLLDSGMRALFLRIFYRTTRTFWRKIYCVFSLICGFINTRDALLCNAFFKALMLQIDFFISYVIFFNTCILLFYLV